MSIWTPTRVRRVTIALLGATTLGLAGARAIVTYVKLSTIGQACLSGCRPGLFCQPDGWLGVCTKECASSVDCPENLICKARGERSVCMWPPTREFGEKCSGSEECKTDLCSSLVYPVRGRRCMLSRCLQHCGTGRACPEGSECVDFEKDPVPVCVPLKLRKEAEADYEALYVRGELDPKHFCY